MNQELSSPAALVQEVMRGTYFSGIIRYNESLSAHSTFRVGGLADVWIQPDASVFPDFVSALLKKASSAGILVHLLGGGSNVLISDKGIRGIVIHTGAWFGYSSKNTFRAGTALDDAITLSADRNQGGLEFLAGIPGTIGGAVWMNARCYGYSISDVLEAVRILNENGDEVTVPFRPEDYEYKKSPFQNRSVVILDATFKLITRSGDSIRLDAESHRQDRDTKGHYRFPCAGSIFKNNRNFGKATGKIIDELGLCGMSIGGAMIAPFHGNIIINTGTATSTDIRNLVDMIMEKVYTATGFTLEPEIIFMGK
ncbi:UDP-N-acetylenolpyruvoylglucosamine reductase [Spirochaetia bacterium]|nr:UDP-N-acetylenolpyruvoylglucosamine reductase [Spirochaetia bacterium]GHU38418.1 UDP-N-acetylenolpyruvoylglucosamine reductase [Spirochaetia bacterium]